LVDGGIPAGQKGITFVLLSLFPELNILSFDANILRQLHSVRILIIVESAID